MRNTILNTVRGLRPIDGMYGVEIEAEGINLPLLNPDIWRTEADGSLKAGMEAAEYVMPLPLPLDGVKKSLDYLDTQYKLHGSKVVETDTSGVHVHLNVQNYTMKELFTLVSLYFIVEELALTYCGESRQGNHFCLRAKDAEFIIHEFTISAENRNLGNLKDDNNRYCSLNPCSLFKYGSLEFRAMRGTGDLNAIYEWVEIIDRIRQSAMEFPDPAEVARVMSIGGEVNFIKRVFKDKAHLFLNVKDCKQMIKEGIRITQPLAFATDWNTYQDRKINPFRRD